jgi:hypothetical protein
MALKSREEVNERLSTALVAIAGKSTANEIAFHITDWKENLEQLIEIYGREDLTNEEIQKMILVFLAHVPNHVAAAKKLIGLGPIEDVFNVGVKDEDE